MEACNTRRVKIIDFYILAICLVFAFEFVLKIEAGTFLGWTIVLLITVIGSMAATPSPNSVHRVLP